MTSQLKVGARVRDKETGALGVVVRHTGVVVFPIVRVDNGYSVKHTSLLAGNKDDCKAARALGLPVVDDERRYAYSDDYRWDDISDTIIVDSLHEETKPMPSDIAITKDTPASTRVKYKNEDAVYLGTSKPDGTYGLLYFAGKTDKFRCSNTHQVQLANQAGRDPNVFSYESLDLKKLEFVAPPPVRPGKETEAGSLLRSLEWGEAYLIDISGDYALIRTTDETVNNWHRGSDLASCKALGFNPNEPKYRSLLRSTLEVISPPALDFKATIEARQIELVKEHIATALREGFKSFIGKPMGIEAKQKLQEETQSTLNELLAGIETKPDPNFKLLSECVAGDRVAFDFIGERRVATVVSERVVNVERPPNYHRRVLCFDCPIPGEGWALNRSRGTEEKEPEEDIRSAEELGLDITIPHYHWTLSNTKVKWLGRRLKNAPTDRIVEIKTVEQLEQRIVELEAKQAVNADVALTRILALEDLHTRLHEQVKTIESKQVSREEFETVVKQTKQSEEAKKTTLKHVNRDTKPGTKVRHVSIPDKEFTLVSHRSNGNEASLVYCAGYNGGYMNSYGDANDYDEASAQLGLPLVKHAGREYLLIYWTHLVEIDPLTTENKPATEPSATAENKPAVEAEADGEIGVVGLLVGAAVGSVISAISKGSPPKPSVSKEIDRVLPPPLVDDAAETVADALEAMQ